MRMKIAGLLKAGKNDTALLECEKLLTVNPLQSQNVELAVEVADATGHPEAALFTVEAAYENNPDDMLLLRRVAEYYMAVGEYNKARDAYVKLNAFLPNDKAIFKQLKDAEARLTMASGWEDAAGKKDGFRKLIADKDQANKLDIQAKAVVSGSDAEALIAEALARIEKEPNNLNSYRALARLYTSGKRFDEAVATLESARAFNAADPRARPSGHDGQNIGLRGPSRRAQGRGRYGGRDGAGDGNAPVHVRRSGVARPALPERSQAAFRSGLAVLQ
jgi:hypothetical protein